MTLREPLLKPVPIRDLRPTQMTVGYREVEQKRRQWRSQAEAKQPAFLGEHMVPVILGPKNRPYIIDHHHLVRALHDEGVESVLTNVVANLSAISKDSFWVVVDNRGWCHPYDASGERCGFGEIPTAIADLTDDPFRSVAGELRRAGGFAKDTTPFSEFLWADFLRRRIKKKAVEEDFEAAIAQALELAKSKDANYLPGWSGPSND
jgi:hypothetical protein